MRIVIFQLSWDPKYYDEILIPVIIQKSHKKGAKTGCSLITHDRHVKNITARLNLYLGILTRLLSYYTINSVEQLFSNFFSSLIPLSINTIYKPSFPDTKETKLLFQKFYFSTYNTQPSYLCWKQRRLQLTNY